MQKSSIRLTVLLAMALALVAVLPDAVHSGVTKAKSSHHATAKASHVSTHHGKNRDDNDNGKLIVVELQRVANVYKKLGINVSVDQLQPYDTDNDGYLSLKELSMIPKGAFLG